MLIIRRMTFLLMKLFVVSAVHHLAEEYGIVMINIEKLSIGAIINIKMRKYVVLDLW